MNARVPHLAVVALVATAASTHAQLPFLDDFDDGNDSGWTRSSPLQGFGVVGDFSFPGGNTYRIRTTTPSPDQEALGPARTGSFRPDLDLANFRIIVDIVDFDDQIGQDLGILAAISDPGLGTLNGYAFSYDSNGEQFFLSRLDGEVPETLGSGGFFIEPGGTYRMSLHRFRGEFLAEVIDLDDPEIPVASVVGFDETYTSGFPGLFNNGLGDEALTDATFDNFYVDDRPDVDFDGLDDPWEFGFFGDIFALEADAGKDPDKDNLTNAQEQAAGTDPTDAGSKFLLSAASIGEDSFSVTFSPALPDRTYTLEVSDDLKTWTAQPAAVLDITDGQGTLSAPLPDDPFGAARVSVTR